MSLPAYLLGLARLALALALLGAWGFTLARWLFGRSLPSGDRFALAAGLSVGSIGVLGYVAFFAGLSLGAVAWAAGMLGVVGALGALAAVRAARARRAAGGFASSGARLWFPWRRVGDRSALGWAALAAGAAALQGIWLSDSADIFYHLAATRSLMVADRPLVTDLMVTRAPDCGLDPTSGVWPTVLALLSRASALDPVSVVRWVSPLLAVVLALSFLALVRRTVGPRGRAAAMVLMLVVAYHLDFRWAVYPNRISLAFVASALAAVLLLAEHVQGRARLVAQAGPLAGAVLLAATVAGVHLVSFVLLAGIYGVFAVLALIRGGPGRAWIVLACVACVVVGGVIAWTKVAPTVAATGSFRLGSPDRMVDVRARIPMVRLGPLALILPGSWLQGSMLTLPGGLAVAVGLLWTGRWRRQRAATQAGWPVPIGDLLAAAVAVLMPLVAFNLVAADIVVEHLWYHLSRMSAIWPIYLGVPVGALYSRLAERGRRSWWRQLSIAVLAAGVLLTGARLGPMLAGPRDLASIWHSRAYDLGFGWGGHVAELREAIGADGHTVIAAPLGLSYHLAGLMPVRVVAVASAHMPYYAERLEGAARRHDVFVLFSSSVTKRQTRRILERYQVEWIMTWTDERGRLLPATARHLEDWPDVAEPVMRDRDHGLAVFRVRRPGKAAGSSGLRTASAR